MDFSLARRLVSTPAPAWGLTNGCSSMKGDKANLEPSVSPFYQIPVHYECSGASAQPANFATNTEMGYALELYLHKEIHY